MLTITQGATRTIRVTGIVDDDGEVLDVTGWEVRAVVRARPGDTLLAEWVSGTQSDEQGRATADGDVVTLEIPPNLSEDWTWDSAQLQIVITEPTGEQRAERIADERIHLDRSIIE